MELVVGVKVALPQAADIVETGCQGDRGRRTRSQLTDDEPKRQRHIVRAGGVDGVGAVKDSCEQIRDYIAKNETRFIDFPGACGDGVDGSAWRCRKSHEFADLVR